MSRLGRIKAFLRKVQKFLAYDIWELDTDNLSRFKVLMLRNIRIIVLTVKNFKKENINWQAVALSFFTLLAFVPFIAMVFAVSEYIGLGEYLMDLIYSQFGRRETVDYLIGFANNIVATSRQGIYGAISFVVFMWMVVWLFICIEKSLNSIWKVRRNRVMWKRVLSYLVAMAVSPFVVIVFLSVSFTITDGINTLGMELPFMKSVSAVLVWLAFYVFMVGGLTSIYILVPNAKVRFLPAFSAASVASFAFIVIQYLYLETQVFVSRMDAIYGVFAAVPLFMIWLNMGWFIILVGSDLSYAFQNVNKYPLEDLS